MDEQSQKSDNNNVDIVSSMLSSLVGGGNQPLRAQNSTSLLEELLKPRSAEDKQSSDNQQQEDFYTQLGKMGTLYDTLHREIMNPLAKLEAKFEDECDDGAVNPDEMPFEVGTNTNKRSFQPVERIIDFSYFNTCELGDLEKHSVASIQRSVQVYSGNLVAANSMYIAYVSKAGVRLIRQSDGEFTLIKRHKDRQPCDLAMSSDNEDDRVKLITLYPDGYCVVEEVLATEKDLKTKVLLEIEAGSPVNRCVMNRDGSRGALLATKDHKIFEIVFDQLKHSSPVSFDCLHEVDGVTMHQVDEEPVACDYSPFEDCLAVAFGERVRMFGGSEDGMSFVSDQQIESICASFRGKDLIFLTGSEANTKISLWDGDAFKKTQILNFLSADFVHFFYHGMSNSLFVAQNDGQVLLRFQLTMGSAELKFELVDKWRLSGGCLSMNADQSASNELDLMIVSSSGVTIYTVPLDQNDQPPAVFEEDQVSMNNNASSVGDGSLQNLMDKIILESSKVKNVVDEKEHQKSKKLEKIVSDALEEKFEDIADCIGPMVDEIIGTHVAEFSHHLDRTLPGVIDRIVQKSIEKSMAKFVSSAVEKALSKNASADTISKAVTVAVNSSVSELMSDNFEKVLIPAYQAATQVMFKQMQNAFHHGLNSTMSDFKQSLQGKQDISQLIDEMNKQMKILQDIQKSLRNVNSPVGNDRPSSADGLKRKIKSLVDVGDFETAFVNAFESGDTNMTVYTMKIADPKRVFFMQGHPVISQPVLLTLIQHTILDLETDQDLKFLWLQECLASLDPRHPLVAEYSKRILPNVVMKLNEWCLETATRQPDNAHLLSVKLLARFANSLLHQ